MTFGLNRVGLIGRLGADVTVNHLTIGGRVANISVATDESYINRQTGERFSNEVLLVPGGRVQFLERPDGSGMATQDGCQGSSKIPQLWSLKNPHPQLTSAGSSARISPDLSLSLSR